jgi:hypothetical protein
VDPCERSPEVNITPRRVAVVTLFSLTIAFAPSALAGVESALHTLPNSTPKDNARVLINTNKWTYSKGFKTSHYLKGRVWDGNTMKTTAFCVDSQHRIGWTTFHEWAAPNPTLKRYSLRCTPNTTHHVVSLIKDSGRHTWHSWQNWKSKTEAQKKTIFNTKAVRYQGGGKNYTLCVALETREGKAWRFPGRINTTVTASKNTNTYTCQYRDKENGDVKTTRKFDLVIKTVGGGRA